MFGIGFFEILVIAVLGLLVFGPEKLPDAIRTFVVGFTKAKRSWTATRRELEQELGMDEIRREIHNAQVMADMEKIKAVRSLQGEKDEETNRLIDSSQQEPKLEPETNTIHSEQGTDQQDNSAPDANTPTGTSSEEDKTK